MTTVCEFCDRSIDSREILAHIHFKHLSQYLVRFRLDPIVCYLAGTWPPKFKQHQLTRGETI